MNKDISVREFKAKLSYYLTVLSTGEVVNVRGLKLKDISFEATKTEQKETSKIGVTTLLTPRDYAKPENTVVTEQKETEKEQFIKNMRAKISQVDAKYKPVTTGVTTLDENVVTEDLPECELCKLPRATRMTWEDGEEHKICEPCVLKKYGTQAKSMLRTMKKL